MKRLLTTLATGAALAALGCAATPMEETWGDSVAAYKAGMIVDPNAGTSDPIEGVDPLTGEIIIETYTERKDTSLSCYSEPPRRADTTAAAVNETADTAQQ